MPLKHSLELRTNHAYEPAGDGYPTLVLKPRLIALYVIIMTVGSS